MHPSPFDFVSVLSREECCPLCSELHAAVDQCECSECNSSVCPDCASLRPDTTWICAACAPAAAALVFPHQVGPLSRSLRLLRASVSSAFGARDGSSVASATGPLLNASALLLERARVGALAFLALTVLFARATRAHTLRVLRRASVRARPTLTQLGIGAQRLQSTLVSHGRRASALGARGLRLTGSQLRARAGQVWLRVAGTAISLRSFPLRHHAASLVIATAILIAVARSQTHSDAR